MIKGVSTERRRSKGNEEIADVELVDNSKTSEEKLATIVVSVFGASKTEELVTAVGTPMTFFNLSVNCSGHEREAQHQPLQQRARDKSA